MSQIHGTCAPGFEPVAEAFEAGLAEELGAGFAFCVDGELVVDLVGAYADRALTRPFDAQTLTPVFSTTRAMASLLIARLVDQGRLGYDQPVAAVWPEFAQA